MKRAINRKPIKIGEKYGSWTVLSEDWYDKDRNATFVKVKCKCGYKKTIRKYTIQKGISKKCKTCTGRESFSGYESLGGYYVGQLKEGAARRNLSFKLTPKEIWDLFIKQDRRCILTGVPLKLSRTIDYKTKNQTASLDRINNDIGYVEGNVRWVHKIVNQMRSNRTDEEFIKWCSLVVKHTGYINTNNKLKST